MIINEKKKPTSHKTHENQVEFISAIAKHKNHLTNMVIATT
jgi:hypothetical protein